MNGNEFFPWKWDLIDLIDMIDLSFFCFCLCFCFRRRRPREDTSQAQMLNNCTSKNHFLRFSVFLFFCFSAFVFFCFVDNLYFQMNQFCFLGIKITFVWEIKSYFCVKRKVHFYMGTIIPDSYFLILVWFSCKIKVLNK